MHRTHAHRKFQLNGFATAHRNLLPHIATCYRTSQVMPWKIPTTYIQLFIFLTTCVVKKAILTRKTYLVFQKIFFSQNNIFHQMSSSVFVGVIALKNFLASLKWLLMSWFKNQTINQLKQLEIKNFLIYLCSF